MTDPPPQLDYARPEKQDTSPLSAEFVSWCIVGILAAGILTAFVLVMWVVLSIP